VKCLLHIQWVVWCFVSWSLWSINVTAVYNNNKLNAIHVCALTRNSHNETNKCTSVEITLFTHSLSYFWHVSMCCDRPYEVTEHHYSIYRNIDWLLNILMMFSNFVRMITTDWNMLELWEIVYKTCHCNTALFFGCIVWIINWCRRCWNWCSSL
jgi:hypothetical protein